MPFQVPLRRERGDRPPSQARSRTHTPSSFTPVIPSPSSTPPPGSPGPDRPGNGPQRNFSTSSSRSGATTTSASSTSSLEAVPMRPQVGTRGDSYDLALGGGPSRAGSRAGSVNLDGTPMPGFAGPQSRGQSPANGNSGFMVFRGNHTPSPPIQLGNPYGPVSKDETTVRVKQKPQLESFSMPGVAAGGTGSARSAGPRMAAQVWGEEDSPLAPGTEPRTRSVSLQPASSAPGSGNRSDTLSPPNTSLLGVPQRAATPPSPSPAPGSSLPPHSPAANASLSPLMSHPQPQHSRQPFPSHHNLASGSSTPPPHTLPQSGPGTPHQRPISQMHHLFLPTELRPSSSGPDLLALQREREREKARKIAEGRTGGRPRSDIGGGRLGAGDSDEEEDGMGMAMDTRRPKMRTRSSSAQVTQIHAEPQMIGSGGGLGGSALEHSPIQALHSLPGSAPGPSSHRIEARKAVTLQDFTFGSLLGRGSYSVVVLAQQNATTLPFAVKILDQHHLVQERKTKYAKVERDALVRLGPRPIGPPGSRSGTPQGNGSSPGSVIGGQQRKGDRRGSMASVGSSKSGKPRKESIEPGKKRRRPSTALGQVGGTLMEREGLEGAAELSGLNGGVGMRRASVTEAGEAFREGRRPIISLNEDGQPIMITTATGAQRPLSTSTSNSTISAPSPTATAFQGLPLKLQTTNLTLPARDESALTLSPTDSVRSMVSRVEELLPPGLVGGGRRKASVSSDRKWAEKRKRAMHPGIVRLHYTFKDDTSLYFVLDLAINGELLEQIKKYGSFDIESARIYAAQVIDAVEFMHERGVIHRDLKPENILLDDDFRVKVSDFGSAKVLDAETKQPIVDPSEDGKKRSFVGTAEYVSPEVLRNEHATAASDVWAFGAILFQMVAGRPPFRGATEYLTFQKVLKAEYEFPEGFDEQAKDLVTSIFNLDPAQRPTVEAIKAHPFFCNTDFLSIWTDQMPHIKTGITPPVRPAALDLTRHGWSEFLGHSASEQSHEGEADDGLESADSDEERMRRPTRRDERLEDDLEEPRRRWIESGGGAGTFSSASGGTDDDVSLVGVGRERTESAAAKERNRSSVGGGGDLNRRTSLQWPTELRREVWANHLAPNEHIVYSSQILSRTGLFLPKRRTLVLTDLPRLICVKEDPTKGIIKVKAECLFGSGGKGVGTEEMERRKVIKCWEKGVRAFVVQTAEKEHTFIADREDIRARWMVELARAGPSSPRRSG